MRISSNENSATNDGTMAD